MKTNLRLFYLLPALLIICTGCPPPPPPPVQTCISKCFTETIHSASLEGNLLGDSPDRSLLIYLPKDYCEDTIRRYPVIYLLHGYYFDQNVWLNGVEKQVIINIKQYLDSLIENEVIAPVIVAAPNSQNKYLGSWYTNSIVAGNWEDYITNDVVQYMDQHYRTIPTAGSRGIAGHSMGGYGAINIAARHPDIFSAVYGMSCADLVFEDSFLDIFKEEVIEAANADKFDVFNLNTSPIISKSVAFAPNQSAVPFMSEFPFDKDGVLVDSSWQKWLAHDPYTNLGNYRQNLEQLTAIQLDCGNSDEFMIESIHFSEALTNMGIDHTFLKYTGNHLNKVDERLKSEVFIFFDLYLEDDE